MTFVQSDATSSDNVRAARTASEKKIAANRKNARESTGPRTRKGKDTVRWNALKQGLLAKTIIIENGDTSEVGRAFRQLLDNLIQDLHPVGTLEHMYVERIAVAYWRILRAFRCETEEVFKEQARV